MEAGRTTHKHVDYHITFIIYVSNKYTRRLSVLPNNPLAFLWIHPSPILEGISYLLFLSLLYPLPLLTFSQWPCCTVKIKIPEENTTFFEAQVYWHVYTCTLILCFYPVLIFKISPSTCVLNLIPSYLRTSLILVNAFSCISSFVSISMSIQV